MACNFVFFFFFTPKADRFLVAGGGLMDGLGFFALPLPELTLMEESTHIYICPTGLPVRVVLINSRMYDPSR